ncbi:conserved hypothetical protein [Leishmania mexicana MHOM/GT/2001/U1103]|uniref:Uncharacterized protein n=1 Tax=Leishmania mexicana (strain MHOM/GT/2001/U1103) TaxID=929439 RepID=E9AY18_LEIMU|nr:conserved hypothetical protein [Leishmania mexicana MHOM/GT/2001/U1103]CBZ27859.1 conserved hypothetical protein [Leishmania mexicana MHOM/GT/2001/U1103]
MRRVRQRLGVRWLSGSTAATWRLNTEVVGPFRRCSTAAEGTAPSASTTPSSAAPPLLPSSSLATSLAAPKILSDAAALFDHYFGDVSTTLDIAPVKRPHVVGSLVCALEEYPISVVLVEQCCGTSAEAVTESVRWRAIHSAQVMRGVSWKSTKTFLVHHLCTARPNVIELLDALDLTLRVRLLRQDDLAATAAEQERTSGDERGVASDVSSRKTKKSTGQRWRCSAELYDTWHTQPRFTPVEPAAGGGEESGDDEVGELLDVIEGALTRVEAKLRQLHMRYARDSVEEACRFVQEAGGDFCEMQLTMRGLRACMEKGDHALYHATRHCPWWGEVRARRSWSLQCNADMDVKHSKAVAFHLCLAFTLHATRSDETNGESGVAAVLQLSEAHCGLAQLVDNKAADGVSRRYTNPASCSALLQDLYAVSTLSRILASGRLSPATDWTCGPMDLANHLVSAAAVLSPTVAYDWIGATRGGSESVAQGTPCRAQETVSTAADVGLPACVRWSSFVGRANLDDFVVHLRGAIGSRERSAATDSCALPPLWPQLGLLHPGTPEDRCAALRELLRHEHGLRGLPRVSVTVCTTPLFSLEYDAELIVKDSDTNAKRVSHCTAGDLTSIQILCGDCYADVAAAAQVHTPWAAPLCNATSAPLPATTAVAQRGKGDHMDTCSVFPDTGNRTHDATNPAFDALECISVDVLSISDSMLAMGFTSATWTANTAKLVAKRGDNAAPAVFEGANTLSGYRRILRFCAKRPVYRTAYLPRRSTLPEALQRLLVTMASSGSNADDDVDTCKRRDDEWPGAHTEEAAILHDQETRAGHTRLGRCGTLMLVFPFNAGAAALQAQTSAAAKKMQQTLFSAVQEHCRDSARLSVWMPAHTRSMEATFFHSWPLTAQWLVPHGSPLHASLTPVFCEEAAIPRRRNAEKVAEDSSGHGATKYDLHLSTTASPSASSAQACSGAEPCSPPLTTAVVVRLPASAAWLSSAHTAMRRALKLSRPDLFAYPSNSVAPSTALGGEEGSDAPAGVEGLLVRCATFTQVVEALLFTATFCELTALDAEAVLKELFGHNVYTKKCGAVTELWLVVAPRMSPVRLCTVSMKEGNLGGSSERKWSMLLQCVMDASCPEARATVEAMRHLRRCVAALATESDRGCLPPQCQLSCEWVLRPSTASEEEPVEWTQVFVAELVRGSPVPSTSASGPRWSKVSMRRRGLGDVAVQSSDGATSAKLPTSVMHREEGPDSFGVLWRMLHSPALQPAQTASLPTAASGQELASAPIPSPGGFIKAAQRALARQRGVARVTHRYDKELGGVVVEGWGRLRQNGSEAPCETPVTLVTEPMALHCVPMHLMQLYHRLLVETHELPRIREAVWERLGAECEKTSTETIVQSLCETLGCTPADLQSVEVRYMKVWTARLELPLRVFGFSAPVTPSPPSSPSAQNPCCDAPPALYVYCHRSSKRQAIRSVYTLLYQWTRYPQMVASVNDAQFRIASNKSAVWPRWGADSPSSPSAPLPCPATTATAEPRPPMMMESATCASEACAAPTAARTPQTLSSVLDAAHARMETSLGALVGCRDGHVTLRLSQTFGLQLMYGVGAAKAQVEVTEMESVQLLREAWVPLVWAPAQILSAEVSVLQRLLTRSTTTTGGGDTDDMRSVLRELVFTNGLAQRAALQSGRDVRAKEFCVSFFRRYFGWRVCEREDVEDISVSDDQSTVVIVQKAEQGALSHGGQRSRPKRVAFSCHSGAAPPGELRHATGTLQLTQIVPGAATSVRLGRILVEVTGATPQAALDALWEPCTLQIESVFGVSRSMSPREADDQMLRFMQSQLE